MTTQLGLFSDAAPRPLPHAAADERLAERLPPWILAGPSTWTFPGSIPPGRRYEEQGAAFAPFDRLVSPDEATRADVVALARACAERRKTLYLIVNNKVEGSSPLTVRAMIERIVAGP